MHKYPSQSSVLRNKEVHDTVIQLWMVCFYPQSQHSIIQWTIIKEWFSFKCSEISHFDIYDLFNQEYRECINLQVSSLSKTELWSLMWTYFSNRTRRRIEVANMMYLTKRAVLLLALASTFKGIIIAHFSPFKV